MDGVVDGDGDGDGTDSPCALVSLAKRGEGQPCQACQAATAQRDSCRKTELLLNAMLCYHIDTHHH